LNPNLPVLAKLNIEVTNKFFCSFSNQDFVSIESEAGLVLCAGEPPVEQSYVDFIRAFF